MPKVSIIIPVYGVEKYIERCARSLFEQTLDDIEYLFIDDCTPDKSIEILRRVLDEYPKRRDQVIIHRMEKNSGQAAVRKWGMINATGDYVIHCDSDDWVDVTMYEKMHKKAIEEDADVVVCDYFIEGDNGIKRLEKGCKNEDSDGFLKDIISQSISWAVWNKMVKRSLYTNTNSFIYPLGTMGEDMVICLQLLLNSKKMTCVNEALYFYYCNVNSITKDHSRENIVNRFEQSVANASIILHVCKEWDIYEKYRDEIDSILLNKKNLIRPLIKEKYYYDIWKSTFSEINQKILFNQKVSIAKKIKHVLTFFRLYKK